MQYFFFFFFFFFVVVLDLLVVVLDLMVVVQSVLPFVLANLGGEFMTMWVVCWLSLRRLLVNSQGIVHCWLFIGSHSVGTGVCVCVC